MAEKTHGRKQILAGRTYFGRGNFGGGNIMANGGIIGQEKKGVKKNPPDLKWTANTVHNHINKSASIDKSKFANKSDGVNKSNGDWKKKSERLDFNEATTGGTTSTRDQARTGGGIQVIHGYPSLETPIY
jgi:hypothetical protein